MCGIAGIVPRTDADPNKMTSILHCMTNQIIHRGPDDSGFHIESEIAIGMRRLSIIDINGGQQPMTSASGNNTIVFNGEIYNYKTIRNELLSLGVQFKNNSDTEVVLEAFDRWGYDSINRLEGMFGFAIWNHQLKILTLVRDHIGQKSINQTEN